MQEKGFESEFTLNETPDFEVTEEKPLIDRDYPKKKVDINILKARVKQIQDRENKKNISIFILSLFILGILGIYLST